MSEAFITWRRSEVASCRAEDEMRRYSFLCAVAAAAAAAVKNSAPNSAFWRIVSYFIRVGGTAGISNTLTPTALRHSFYSPPLAVAVRRILQLLSLLAILLSLAYATALSLIHTADADETKLSRRRCEHTRRQSRQLTSDDIMMSFIVEKNGKS